MACGAGLLPLPDLETVDLALVALVLEEEVPQVAGHPDQLQVLFASVSCFPVLHPHFPANR